MNGNYKMKVIFCKKCIISNLKPNIKIDYPLVSVQHVKITQLKIKSYHHLREKFTKTYTLKK